MIYLVTVTELEQVTTSYTVLPSPLTTLAQSS
jgi:hypothetical protein